MSTYYEELCQAARRIGNEHAGRDDHEKRARHFMRDLRETWARGRIDWAEYLRLIDLTSPSSPSTAELPIIRPDTAAESRSAVGCGPPAGSSRR